MSGGRTPDDRPPERVAIGFIQDAAAYRLAALRVQPRGAPEGEVNLANPAWHLLCHSAELALKAFLSSHGVPLHAKPGGLASRELGHELARLHALALEHGFVPAHEEFGELVEWLGPYHATHAFRYRQPGRALLPAPFFIAEILEPVIAAISTTVRERWREKEGKR